MLRYLFFILFLPFSALSQTSSTAIKNVNIIDVEMGVVKHNQTVVIENGIINAIGINLTLPKNAVQINGKGKYLMPGLWDMHFHMRDNIANGWEVNEKVSLPLLLANGVTGVRYMSGNAGLLELRNRINRKETLGPRLIISTPSLIGRSSSASRYLHIRDTSHARIAIDSLAALSYDLAKIYTCWPDKEVFFAVAKACKRNRLPFSGHIPATVTAEEAIQAGMISIEHLHGAREAYATNENDLVAFQSEICKTRRSLMKALDSVTTLMAANYDEKRGTYLNRLMKAKGVYPTPTQFVLGYIELAGKRDSISRADSSFMRYTPKTLKTKLMDEAVPASEAESVAISQRKENVYAKRMIRQMYKQGVPMLVGTDAPGFPLVPGFSVHQEMEHLVEIGMSTKAVLQAATINPARSLGWDKQMGSVAICKEADLILLDKNPLQDIKNIKKIHTVFVRGKLLTKKALEKMLEDVSLLCK